MKQQIWFWQTLFSPHMAFLAESLASKGYQVFFVSGQLMSQERLLQGWEIPKVRNIEFLILKDIKNLNNFYSKFHNDSIHITQGLRGNEIIKEVQKFFIRENIKFWIIMESIEERFAFKIIKRVVYSALIKKYQPHLIGILAIGHGTKEWLLARGAEKNKVFPFAYFLKSLDITQLVKAKKIYSNNDSFKIIFVGSLIRLKRVDLLINAVSKISIKKVELAIIGSGPEFKSLNRLAQERIPGSVIFLGNQKSSLINSFLNQADCLVLPSRYDGWGAVVSESLIVGTPVICSDKCGAMSAVLASKVGGVFNNNEHSLAEKISQLIYYVESKPNLRKELRIWARCLTAQYGCDYLMQVINKGSKVNNSWLEDTNYE